MHLNQEGASRTRAILTVSWKKCHYHFFANLASINAKRLLNIICISRQRFEFCQVSGYAGPTFQRCDWPALMEALSGMMPAMTGGKRSAEQLSAPGRRERKRSPKAPRNKGDERSLSADVEGEENRSRSSGICFPLLPHLPTVSARRLCFWAPWENVFSLADLARIIARPSASLLSWQASSLTVPPSERANRNVEKLDRRIQILGRTRISALRCK